MNANYLKFFSYSTKHILACNSRIYKPIMFLSWFLFCLNQTFLIRLKQSFCLISVMHIFWNFTECMNKSKLFTFCFPETLQLFMVHARGKLDLSFIAGSLTKHELFFMFFLSICHLSGRELHQDWRHVKAKRNHNYWAVFLCGLWWEL